MCAGNQRWKGLTWGMLPLLGGAMAACTYHLFYNPPELDILVALQVDGANMYVCTVHACLEHL